MNVGPFGLVRWLAAAAAVLTVAAVSPAAFIVQVTVDVQPAVGALFRYEYQLANDPLSDLSATDFALTVAAQADLQPVAAPDGWTVAYAPGSELYFAFSGGPETDIAPGQVGTFVFLSPLAPGPQTYSSFGLNPVTFDFDTAAGTAAGPTTAPAAVPVPGPDSAGLFALGTVAAALAGRCRRRGPDGVSPSGIRW